MATEELTAAWVVCGGPLVPTRRRRRRRARVRAHAAALPPPVLRLPELNFLFSRVAGKPLPVFPNDLSAECGLAASPWPSVVAAASATFAASLTHELVANLLFVSGICISVVRNSFWRIVRSILMLRRYFSSMVLAGRMAAALRGAAASPGACVSSRLRCFRLLKAILWGWLDPNLQCRHDTACCHAYHIVPASR